MKSALIVVCKNMVQKSLVCFLISSWKYEGQSEKSQPLYFGNDPVAEIVPLFLNIISLCLNVISSTLLQFAYLFKIEAFFLVRQVLINNIYESFIASKIPTTEVSFQIWKQKSEGIKSGEQRG